MWEKTSPLIKVVTDLNLRFFKLAFGKRDNKLMFAILVIHVTFSDPLLSVFGMAATPFLCNGTLLFQGFASDNLLDSH